MADIISRLKLESGEFDSKIKRAGQELLAYSEHCKKTGLQMGYANRDAKEFARQLGSMQTTSQTARGKINELSDAFVNLKVMYKQMTDEEKKGEFGKTLNASLNQLKTRIDAAKKDLADVTKELGGTQTQGVDLSNVMQTLGSKFGISSDAIGLLTTGTIGYTAAIGGLTTAVIAGTKAWADYNEELARQSQITTVTTGLKGSDADRMADAAKAVADVYGTDFREVINAANTLMTQFGQTGEQAMSLIRDGMQGMLQGDGPKLLSMIQQYAPSFRDAGIAASQLVAIIQNSEGGIFTDQNMNAIVMGIKNIRLMTKATSDALAQLGIDGQKMSKDLSEGTITIFDALKQVATQIQGVNSNSQAAGEVMQQVFGRQGAMAGTKLGEAIATLNTNLEETKRQTGEVGQAYADLQGATERLNGVIREAFGYDGYEVMATGIRTKLYTAMADVLDLSLKIKDSWVGNVGKTIFDVMTDAASKALGPLGSVLSLLRSINSEKGGGSNGKKSGYSDIDKTLEYIGKGANEAERQKRYDAAINDLRKKINNLDKEHKRKNPDGSTSFYILSQDKQDEYRDALERRIKILEDNRERVVSASDSVISPIKPITPKGGKTTTVKEDKDDFEEIVGLIPNAEEAVKSLQQQIRESWDEGEIASLTKDLEKAEAELQRLKAIGKEAKPKEMVQGLSGFNAQTMSAWMSGRQSDLSKAEYGSADYSGIMANIADMNAIKTVLEQSMKAGIDAAQFDLEPLWEEVFDGENIKDSTWQSMIDTINEKLKELHLEPIQLDFQTGNVKSQAKEMAKDWQAAGSAIQAVGSAMSQIEDPAAKVMGTIAQAIATIALTFASSLKGTFTPWDWIAAAAAGTATMISTIAAIHSATGYANGGVVKGSSYSGDNIPALVDGSELVGLNAGEIVLNAAMAGNVAQGLQSAGLQNLNLDTVISAEEIRLVLNNNGRRTGRGEYVTTRNSKIR